MCSSAAFSEGKNWQDDIIRSVLSEFLISVFQNDLVVSVGDTEISSETLPALVEKYREVTRKYSTIIRR